MRSGSSIGPFCQLNICFLSLQMVGGRPPFYIKYKIGAMKDGTLTSVRMKIYQDQVKAFGTGSSHLVEWFVRCK
jgi:hypothetical protein